MRVNQIYPGDCLEVMATWPENFVDTIITDPPYGIGFMGKEWDRFDPNMIERRTKGYREKAVKDGLDKRITKTMDSAALYAGLYDQSLEGHRGFQSWCCAWGTEALRVAKPGALMLVSGGTRTFHRMTAGLEDAGWQIRDCVMWLYGSGFPKSWNFKEGAFKGWGTALKPAWEPILVAMKPTDGTFAENAETWGVAGINVDGGRIRTSDVLSIGTGRMGYHGADGSNTGEQSGKGRWPANLLLDEEAAAMLDGQSGALHAPCSNGSSGNSGFIANGVRLAQTQSFRDSGGASRFFYVAKADRTERNEGCDELPDVIHAASNGAKAAAKRGETYDKSVSGINRVQVVKNNHPTVKPLSLMKYLCNLTRTPTGGIVLDPFCGSGTTLWAAEYHNRPWIGIEMNPEYVAIANARIARERAQLKMAI